MKQTILNIINSNADYIERALDAVCKNKVFVVVHGERIVGFNRTIFGAEFSVKQDADNYYDFSIKERVQVEEPLQIVEISAFDIVGFECEE